MKKFVLISALFSYSVFAAQCPTNIVASCTSGNGTFSQNPCAVEKLAGSCVVPFGQQDGMITSFYSPMREDMVETVCIGMSGKTFK